MPGTGNIMTGRNGVTYKLGQSLGRGGESTVYEVEGRSDVVAKIYSASKLNSHRIFLREKIETMLDQPINAYDKDKILNVAWPQDILMDSSRVFFGYTMPRVNSKYHIFDVCRETKMSIFPNYNWKISVAIAYNLASAVAKIHKGGVAVGDLNPNNIMVDSRGYITLIDTDSFNIRNKKTGKEYKCTVGMPKVLPPELQVPDLTNEPFNEASDCFSLAIHIFNLLMNDCHPFGCLNMNINRSSSSLLTVEHNITSGFCPYVNSSHGKPAVTAPDYNMLPSDIRDLFERVFRYDASTAVRSAVINNRPSAAEWSAVFAD